MYFFLALWPTVSAVFHMMNIKFEYNDTANEANTIGYYVNPFMGVSYDPILICDNVAMVK
jgi:hypothetical protein